MKQWLQASYLIKFRVFSNSLMYNMILKRRCGMRKKQMWLLFSVCILLVVAGCAERIKPVEIRHLYSRGRVDNLMPEELILEQTLNEAAKIDAAKRYAQGMFDVAYIIAAEHPDLGFTVYLKGNEVVVERGLDTSKEPTLVIPLYDDAIMNTKRFFEDGVVDAREEFLIVNGLFKPAWEASYRIPEMQSRWIRKFMKLDGFMHVMLLNKDNYEYQGKVAKNELSVVRASNQWLILNGLEGIADSRMELTAKDSVAMYKLIMRDLKRAKSIKEKMDIMSEFEKIRKRCLVK